jgi:hypothetical protein
MSHAMSQSSSTNAIRWDSAPLAATRRALAAEATGTFVAIAESCLKREE